MFDVFGAYSEKVCAYSMERVQRQHKTLNDHGGVDAIRRDEETFLRFVHTLNRAGNADDAQYAGENSIDEKAQVLCRQRRRENCLRCAPDN